MKSIKEARIKSGLTQKEAALLVGVSLRTFSTYENSIIREESMKYEYIIDKLEKVNFIDEETGLLTINKITEICTDVFKNYNVEFAYLFGSYAKGKQTEKSDVDLLVSTEADGLQYYALVEDLREALHKKIDLLDVDQLKDNLELTKEILKDGVKIYG